MAKWDPERYLAFADLRLRPALDLLARIPLEAPDHVTDLGCGAGNVTRVLRERWPQAAITGIDGSPEMLEVARRDASGPMAGIEWKAADIGDWRPAAPVDVLYSNAALHWLRDHHELFPRLLSLVAQGGVLAVQMPRNPDAPFQALMTEVAKDGPWWETLAPLLRPDPVGEPGFYYDLLSPLARHVELWETTYAQVLSGDNPVLDWVKGSRLRPLLAALDDPWRSEYEAEYAARVAAAYPRLAGGETMLAFRRLFLVVLA